MSLVNKNSLMLFQEPREPELICNLIYTLEILQQLLYHDGKNKCRERSACFEQVGMTPFLFSGTQCVTFMAMTFDTPKRCCESLPRRQTTLAADMVQPTALDGSDED